MVSFEIPTRPVTKARPKLGRGNTYTPQKTVDYENEVHTAWLLAGSPRVEGPLRVTVELTPEGATVTLEEIDVTNSKLTGDVDNYAKSVLDALQDKVRDGVVTRAGAYRNDKQVHELVAVKR